MNYKVVVGEDICHYGKKGQKWGIRRYQNEDGSLTPEGRKRYGAETVEGAYKNRSKKREAQAEIANKMKKVGSEAAELKFSYKNKARINMMNLIDPTELTDDQIRDRINRIKLERSYKEALADEYEKVHGGKLSANDILKNVGTIAATASAVITVASAVNQLLSSKAALDAVKAKIND